MFSFRTELYLVFFIHDRQQRKTQIHLNARDIDVLYMAYFDWHAIVSALCTITYPSKCQGELHNPQRLHLLHNSNIIERFG